MSKLSTRKALGGLRKELHKGRHAGEDYVRLVHSPPPRLQRLRTLFSVRVSRPLDSLIEKLARFFAF